MQEDLLRSSWAQHWLLDPEVTFLNHGSFGACPKPVLEIQQHWRLQMERQPVQFLVRDLEAALDAARQSLSELLHAPAADIGWVRNATTGVNAVLRSYPLRAGDELLTTNQGYNACCNALRFVAEQARARVVVADIPFPLQSPDQVVAAVLSQVTPRTRLALLDHVTSPTGIVLPIRQLIRELSDRGVETLIDGAHAPGMIPLDLSAWRPTYYTGNCHKWLCAPKGTAFLYTHPDHQAHVRPTTISHGANTTRTDRSRYLIEFDWVGTDDPTPVLCLPAAIQFLQSLLPGGLAELQQRNRRLALAARGLLCQALAVEAPAPESMIASLASVALPDSDDPGPGNVAWEDPLQTELRSRCKIEVPVVSWPAHPQRWIRISAQAYNDLRQYERLADCLRERLGRHDSW